jgi:hypothetical protein
MRRTVVLLLSGLCLGLAVLGGSGGSLAAETSRARSATVKTAAASKAIVEAEEARLLSVLPLPPGAATLGGEPPEAGGVLAGSTLPAIDAPIVLERTGWWTVPATPRAAILYAGEHLPELSPFSRFVFPVAIQPGTLRARIRLVEGTGAVGERWLVLTSTTLPSGLSALRADAQIVWVRPRDPIPPRARVLRVTVTRLRGGPNARSFTVRGRGKARAVLRLLNSLLPARPSLLPKPCPAESGTIVLAFFSSPRARSPLATAKASVGGCGGIELRIKGQPAQPELKEPGTGIVAPLERVLGRGHLLPFHG